MRAGLLFVIAALSIGQGFREWQRSHETAFRDLVRELEQGAEPEGSEAPDTTVAKRPRPSREVAVARVDLNRAGTAELIRLPGIGPSLAARIVADREERGPFATPEALLRVRGIGPKTLDRIRGFLSTPRPVGGDSLTGF